MCGVNFSTTRINREVEKQKPRKRQSYKNCQMLVNEWRKREIDEKNGARLKPQPKTNETTAIATEYVPNSVYIHADKLDKKEKNLWKFKFSFTINERKNRKVPSGRNRRFSNDPIFICGSLNARNSARSIRLQNVCTLHTALSILRLCTMATDNYFNSMLFSLSFIRLFFGNKKLFFAIAFFGKCKTYIYICI